MFGSNPFGQSTSSPFGSQPAFGQANNASSNPFAPKPFGSTSPFGSQTGGSIFGGMSTGAFGAPTSSPLGSNSVFGASSSPAFGSPTPAFGASSGSAFGNSSSSFGGSSVFGQKATFGGFGASNTQASPFGSSFQQSQPAFGSNLFGSSAPFGASSQPAFGSASTPAFGVTSSPGFGNTSTPAFGSTGSPVFGSTGGGFGLASSPFGSSTPAFGASSTPAFGASSTPAFGASTTPAFGASSIPAFGASSTPAFGATGSPAFGSNALGFGAPSAPSFNIGSSPAFGQSAPAFGSSPFGATSNFGVQTTSFGSQTSTPAFGSTAFGQSSFGGQRGGSRVVSYSPVPETDGATGTQPAGKLFSISAMSAYKDKSHEELRWEDYQSGDKGGPAPSSQALPGGGFGTSAFGSSSTPAFSQASANPFSSSTTSNPFATKTPIFSSSGFGSSTSAFGSSPFGASNNSNIFGSTTSATTSLFGSTAPAFGGNTSPLFSSASSSAFGSPSIFGSASAPGAASTFGTGLSFGNTQSSPLFQSLTPSVGQTSSPFGQSPSAFGQASTGFGQSNLFGTPSTGFGGNLFSSSSSLLSTNTLGFGQTTQPSFTTPFQSAQPVQSSGGFNFSSFGQSPAGGTSAFGATPGGVFGNAAFGQASGNFQAPVLPQAAPPMNPFGTLPAMPQMSIGRSGVSPSMQYGISSLPVVDKPAAVRISSLLTSRHLSQRRLRLPVRKYNPKTDGPKVPFFSDAEEIPSTPKADALFVPRENPRALVVRPIDQWPSRSSSHTVKTTGGGGRTHEIENGKSHSDGGDSNRGKDGGTFRSADDDSGKAKEEEPVTPSVNVKQKRVEFHRDGRGGAPDTIESLMPKLRHPEYYTEPRIAELAARERAEPGYCARVKDFVVGRQGCGSIRFFGETDVRGVEIESVVQLNDREVMVYMDESKKPPAGQGLNKAAEVTLLNIKCVDRKTGEQYTEGSRVERYRAMLKKKAEDQGAEFVWFDPVKGEWKFRVSHFSLYSLPEEEEEEARSVVSS